MNSHAANNRGFADLVLEVKQPSISEDRQGQRLNGIGRFNLKFEANPTTGSDNKTSQGIQYSKHFQLNVAVTAGRLADLRWYLTDYCLWPDGQFSQRAKQIEQHLLPWGQQLLAGLTADDTAAALFSQWLAASGLRRFTLLLQHSDDSQAVNVFFQFPWELLHDGQNFLFCGSRPLLFSRQLVNLREPPIVTLNPNLDPHSPADHRQTVVRVLLICPRPVKDHQGQPLSTLDHRLGIKALLAVNRQLGDQRFMVDMVQPPTFAALAATLAYADSQQQPYQVVHFDGYGIFDSGNSQLLLEPDLGDDPAYTDPTSQTTELGLLGQQLAPGSQLIDGQQLVPLLLKNRVKLLYLDIRSPDHQPTEKADLIASQLQCMGLAAVVVNRYPLTDTTLNLLFGGFYQQLAVGQTVQSALQSAYQTLSEHPYRMPGFTDDGVTLQDWFLSHLYLSPNQRDLVFVTGNDATVSQGVAEKPHVYGALPAPPSFAANGLAQLAIELERILLYSQYAVIVGQQHMGKTTAVVELGRHFIQNGRFNQLIYLKITSQSGLDLTALQRQISQQLQVKASTNYQTADLTWRGIHQVLANTPCLIIFDDLQLMLEAWTQGLIDDANVSEFWLMCQRLCAAGATGLLLTSTHPLPAPFDQPLYHVTLPPLAPKQAVILLKNAMLAQQIRLPEHDRVFTAQQLIDVVKLVKCHPKPLLTIAPLLAEGIEHTKQKVTQLLQRIAKFSSSPDENAEYVALALSLADLSPQQDGLIDKLAVMGDGGHLFVLKEVLGIDIDEAFDLSDLLIKRGLATLFEYNYLQLAPYVSRYARLGQSKQQLAVLNQRWFAAMEPLVLFLHNGIAESLSMVVFLAGLEWPNLERLKKHLQQQVAHSGRQRRKSDTSATDKQQTIAMIDKLAAVLHGETIADDGQYPVPVSTTTEVAVVKPVLGPHQQFEKSRGHIRKAFNQGRLKEAQADAKLLIDKLTPLGPESYGEWVYDMASIHCLLAQILKAQAKVETAMVVLAQANDYIDSLAEQGWGLKVSYLTEYGDCLVAQGKLPQAVNYYQQRIALCQQLDDQKGIAAGHYAMAKVQGILGQYKAAIAGYERAISLYAQLKQPNQLAKVWHQLAVTCQDAGGYDQAESAFRRSLDFYRRLDDLTGQAINYVLLGQLYAHHWLRYEEAVKAFQQAVDIYLQIGDKRLEGLTRSQMAQPLIKLKRIGQARSEVQRSIDCNGQVGTANEPWKAFAVLEQLELADNNKEKAEQAWQKARAAYLAYREQGGVAQFPSGRLAEGLLQLLKEGKRSDAMLLIQGYQQAEETAEVYKPFLQKLQRLVLGKIYPNMANDRRLHYSAAAEVSLLLQRLYNK